MSLEAAVRENTEAIYAFIAEISRSNLRTPVIPGGAYETKAIPPCSGHAAQQEVDIATADALDPSLAQVVTYDSLKESLAGVVAARGKQAAIDLLEKYGAKKLPDVDQANYALLYEDIKDLG